MLIFCRNQTFTSPTLSFSIIGANFTLKYMKAMDSSCYTYLGFKCWVYIVINNQKYPLTWCVCVCLSFQFKFGNEEKNLGCKI